MVANSFSAQSPFTLINSTASVANAVLYTAVSVGNKVLSNEPIFPPAPIIKTLSVNARNLSSQPILSGRISEVASLAQAENDTDATPDQSKQATSEAINTDDAATTDSKVCFAALCSHMLCFPLPIRLPLKSNKAYMLCAEGCMCSGATMHMLDKDCHVSLLACMCCAPV